MMNLKNTNKNQLIRLKNKFWNNVYTNSFSNNQMYIHMMNQMLGTSRLVHLLHYFSNRMLRKLVYALDIFSLLQNLYLYFGHIFSLYKCWDIESILRLN